MSGVVPPQESPDLSRARPRVSARPIAVSGTGSLVGRTARGNTHPRDDRRGPRRYAELLVDMSEVVLHGLFGEEKASGDLTVGQPLRDKAHHVHLACGQAEAGLVR